MKTNFQKSRPLIAAFALKDLLTILCITGLLLCIVVAEIARGLRRAKIITCNCHLKQIGLAFRTWGLDHHDLFPMGVSTNFGGSQEYLATGETFRHFQVMSNELSTPRVLACPQDSHRPAQDFGSRLGNASVSYFAGIVTNSDNPQMFLSGDRNITGGTMLANQILELSTNDLPCWSATIHKGIGNVGLADGSVNQFTTARLQEAARWTGAATSRLAMPGK